MSKEIIKTATSNDNTQNLQPNPSEKPAPINPFRRWPTAIAIVLLAGAAGGGIYALIQIGIAFFIENTARATFITGNAVNLFVFLAIVAQACIYLGQRHVMIQQWKAMTAQLEAINIQEGHLSVQAQAAKDAAEEMVKASKHAEQALRISQRAYVGVKMHPLIFWDESGRPIVTLYFTNSGHTPARKAELDFEYIIGSGIFKDHKGPFTIDAHTDKSIDCHWRDAVAFDKEHRDRIDNNEDTLFFEAELTYLDVWNDSQPPVILHYSYNAGALAMEEFFEGERQHQEENEEWDSKVDPSLGDPN